MTGPEFSAIRKRLGLSLYDWGRAIGYEGNRNTIQVAISRYEREDRAIPPWIARLATMFDRYGVSSDMLE